ncbi:anaerobic sulfatase-maturating enzyme [Oxobacter pfennigii]|uniref:Anaerobic sulfatase-maturating enzyme n=1 Tax=Oxobacter pfennigii TaxID=36849 RepID=A0A0N8NTA8_9CLOT|nr:anaerobic sulfatase maturase [Oxobacter pfennigii]KPU44312.1 anaerobic sulfatase-maturating enzyme [Oxobacter pfennigii]
MEPFVVMAKPVGPRCNLKCSYCYYLETEKFHKDSQQLKMSDSMLETYIRQYIEASPGPVIQFTWHGGEPTLAGLDFYKRVVELQKQYLPEGWNLWNNLQTNGILLDDEWCSFLAENHFDIGLSIDGTQWLHDEFRKDYSGKGTYDKVAAAVNRLKVHGIKPDLLCTVTSKTAKEPEAVYRALRNLDTGWIQFIPIVRRGEDGKVTEDSVSGEEYGNFLCSIFDEWIRYDIGRLDVQLFAEMMMVWSGGNASLCWMAPTCGRVLILEQDGGVYSCDHFVTPDYKIGDIESSDLGTLVNLQIQRNFGNNKREGLTMQCRSCNWLNICNGGCLKDRFAHDENDELGLYYLCGGLKRFFDHAEQPLKQVMEFKKRGLNSNDIMHKLRTQLKDKQKSLGRNDPCPCGSGRKAKNCCFSKRA